MEATWSTDNSLIKEEVSEDDGNDAEGVWSADIEQSFLEALAIYPPCGRRKIILSDEGKMYGRNELIARYIKLRTGKNRTRKQVSSHIQVLARRKTKEVQNSIKDPSSKEKALHTLSQLSSAQIVSASALHNRNLSDSMQTNNVGFWPHQQSTSAQSTVGGNMAAATTDDAAWSSIPDFGVPSVWQEQSIASAKLHLIELTAYVESPPSQRGQASIMLNNTNSMESESADAPRHSHVFAHIAQQSNYMHPVLETVDISQIVDKFPVMKLGSLGELYERGPKSAFFLVKFWADINTPLADGAIYGITSVFEGIENCPIKCSTKVCSFGKQVVEKIDKDVLPQYENGKFVYRVERSPMCEYMINFITKLRQLPEKYMMNSVLENFTILQIITNQETHETLLCICYAFEVSSSDHGAQHHIYKLVAN